MGRQPKVGLAERLRALSAATQAVSGRVDPALID